MSKKTAATTTPNRNVPEKAYSPVKVKKGTDTLEGLLTQIPEDTTQCKALEAKSARNCILITLVQINLSLQCSKDFSLTERILQNLSDTPFYIHLDNWIAQFAQSESLLGFRAYLYSLIRRMPRKHSFMDQEFNRIGTNMMKKFDSWGLK